MLIASQHKLSQIHDNFTVRVGNTPLYRFVKYKPLGVHIDDSLTWRPHNDAISKKISAALAVWRVSPTVPRGTRTTMPYFSYCSPVLLQNRAARIVTFSGYGNCSGDLLDELGWEKLEIKRLKQLAVMMYKVHNNLSPPYVKLIFTNISTVHLHNLWNSQSNCYIPSPRSAFSKGSLHVLHGIWSMEQNTPQDQTASQFEQFLKSH